MNDSDDICGVRLNFSSPPAGGIACAEESARRFEAVEQAAGFFPDVVNPFAEVGARRAFAVASET